MAAARALTVPLRVEPAAAGSRTNGEIGGFALRTLSFGPRQRCTNQRTMNGPFVLIANLFAGLSLCGLIWFGRFGCAHFGVGLDRLRLFQRFVVFHQLFVRYLFID